MTSRTLRWGPNAVLAAAAVLLVAGTALGADRTDQVPAWPGDLSSSGLLAAASHVSDPAELAPYLPEGIQEGVAQFLAESRALGLAKRSTRLILSAPTNVRANDPTGDRVGETQSEVSVAMYGDTVVVGWNDSKGFTAGFTLSSYAYSTNGGASFVDGGNVPLALPTDQSFGDTVLDTDEQGYWYLNSIYTRTAGNPGPTAQQNIGVHRGRFVAGVLVWNAPTMASIGTSSTGNLDKCWIAADRVSRNVYVAYTRFTSPSRIEIVRSTDFGVTWSATPTLLDGTTTPTSSKQAARIICGPAGEVYVVWEKGANSIFCPDGGGNVGTYNSALIAFSRSLDFGATYSAFTTVGSGQLETSFMWSGPGDNRERGNDFPDIAVDRSGGPYNGRLYVTWHETGNWTTNVSAGPARPEAADAANADPALAEVFNVGDDVTGTITSTADRDYWRFSAVQGQSYYFQVDPQGFNCGVSGTTRGVRMRIYAVQSPFPSPAGTFPDTMLAASTQGTFQGRIVWTCPKTADYLVRIHHNTGTTPYTYGLKVRPLTFGAPSPARDARDVVLVTSSDQGSTWSPERILNDDPAGLENRRPFIACDALGHVHAFWHDSRLPGLGSTAALTSIFGTTSRDGGATWTSNYRVTDELSFFSFNALAIPNLGDYNMAMSSGAKTMAAWSDQRLSTGDVRDPATGNYTAGRGPEAYTATVQFDHAVACPVDPILPRGTTSSLSFCVTNTGTVPDTYTYTLMDAMGWLVGGPLGGTIGPLDPGGSACINASVAVPPTCPGGVDVVTWTVTPVGDAFGGVRTCASSITCEPTVPVVVSEFSVQSEGTGVAITWTADDLADVQGWNLYRGLTVEGTQTRVNESLLPAANGPRFAFRDEPEQMSGTVHYRLAAVNHDGTEETVAVGSAQIQSAPRRVAFALAGANPFRERTAFSFAVPEATPVRVEVFNVAGQRVRTLVDRVAGPGVYTVPLDLRGDDDLGAGVYLVRLRAGKIEKTLRVIAIQ